MKRLFAQIVLVLNSLLPALAESPAAVCNFSEQYPFQAALIIRQNRLSDGDLLNAAVRAQETTDGIELKLIPKSFSELLEEQRRWRERIRSYPTIGCGHVSMIPELPPERVLGRRLEAKLTDSTGWKLTFGQAKLESVSTLDLPIPDVDTSDEP